MDFLSIASTAANLLSATIQVLRTTYTYGMGIKSPAEDITRLIHELKLIRKQLGDLENLALRLASTQDSKPSEFENSQDLDQAFKLCYRTLENLFKALYVNDTAKKPLGDMLTPFKSNESSNDRTVWPISKVETRHTITKFRVIKGFIGTFVSTCEM